LAGKRDLFFCNLHSVLVNNGVGWQRGQARCPSYEMKRIGYYRTVGAKHSGDKFCINALILMSECFAPPPRLTFCFVVVFYKEEIKLMPSPFPGMNPYLENPKLWQQIHKRLIVEIANAMNPKIRPKYPIEIEERIYEVNPSNGDSLLVGIPDDVVVKTSAKSSPSPEGNLAVASPPSQPIKVTLSLPTKVKEWYLEVKEVESGEVITAIEILSPKNKAAGEGRKSYQRKRQQILTSLTNLIEIDLLRRGKKMVVDIPVKSDYHILVSRSSDRPQADLYAFNLPDPIPEIPLPLTGGELEPKINLQELLNSVYDLGSYDLVIDYQKEPIIPLGKRDRSWADDLLKQQGLREIKGASQF